MTSPDVVQTLRAVTFAHRGHRTYRRIRSGSFCGRRLVTELTRCATCGGGLIGALQYEVRRGQRH